MRIFVIEAYGGRERIDGPVANFTVHAATPDQAVDLVRHSARGQRFDRFELVEETAEFEGEGPEIIEEYEGPYQRAE